MEAIAAPDRVREALERDVTRPISTGRDLADVKEAYLSLMVAYDRVLAQASRMGRVSGDDPVAEIVERHDALPPLIRLMVRVHVRNRLREIATAFAQMAAGQDSSSKSVRRWLDEARVDCERVIAGLPSGRFRPVVLLPLTAPAAALLSNHLSGWMGSVLTALAATFVAVAPGAEAQAKEPR